MSKLLNKELKLAAHPTTFIFLALSAMLLIPAYPYYVTFFYTCLGVFFICLTGRENHDIFYTMLLPVRKEDVVKARFSFIIIIELLQLLVAVPFAILHRGYADPTNTVGMDANVALFGMTFILFGLFNLVFLTKYYANPDGVGKAFVISSTVVFLYIILAEALVYVVPLFRDKLDTPDPQFLTEKLIVLACGIVIYAALTALAFVKSRRSFLKLDL